VVKKANLVDICGGHEQEVKAEFLSAVSPVKLDSGTYELMLTVWQHGFNTMHNLMIDAIRTGRVILLAHDSDNSISIFVPREKYFKKRLDKRANIVYNNIYKE